MYINSKDSFLSRPLVCCDKWPPTTMWLTPTEMYSLQRRRPAVQNQGVYRVLSGSRGPTSVRSGLLEPLIVPGNSSIISLLWHQQHLVSTCVFVRLCV